MKLNLAFGMLLLFIFYLFNLKLMPVMTMVLSSHSLCGTVFLSFNILS